MFVRILLSLFLLLSVTIGYSADTLTVNKGKIQPTKYNMQLPMYPVFYFSIPEGFTDFELKASITNFKAPGDTDIEDKPTDNGIYVTYKLAKNKGYKINDEIEWHIYGDNKYYKSKIIIVSASYDIRFIAEKYNVGCLSKSTLVQNPLVYELKIKEALKL